MLLAEAQRAGYGAAFAAPYDVVFSEHDVTKADLLFIAKDRKNIITDANVQGAPDLVMEIFSEGSRKRAVLTKRLRVPISRDAHGCRPRNAASSGSTRTKNSEYAADTAGPSMSRNGEPPATPSFQ